MIVFIQIVIDWGIEIVYRTIFVRYIIMDASFIKSTFLFVDAMYIHVFNHRYFKWPRNKF